MSRWPLSIYSHHNLPFVYVLLEIKVFVTGSQIRSSQASADMSLQIKILKLQFWS